METVVLSADDEAQSIIESFGIPPCPEVLVKVLGEMRRDDPDFARVGNLITSDVSLAGAVLKTVNSPFYGLSKKVSSVDHALKLLGLKNIKQITSGLLLRDALPVGDNIVLGKFWDSASAIAQVTALIARPVARLDSDDAYTFALFRDSGLPLMVRRFDEYDHEFVESATGETPLTQLERARFGTDHARIGALLAKSWFLPDDIANAIALHHEHTTLYESGVSGMTRRLVALALVAENIHSRMSTGNDCIDWSLGGQTAMDILDITSDDIEEQRDMVEGILGF